MGNRHVRNLAASLMCCPMVTHPIHTLVSAIRCICNCICICTWVCVCVCNTYYILCIGIVIFIWIWICRCIFVSFLNVLPHGNWSTLLSATADVFVFVFLAGSLMVTDRLHTLVLSSRKWSITCPQRFISCIFLGIIGSSC